MRVTAANGAESPEAANGASKLIAVPRTGPGKRRLVARDSFEGRTVQLANQLADEVARAIAPTIVERCRDLTESMVRERIGALLGRLA